LTNYEEATMNEQITLIDRDTKLSTLIGANNGAYGTLSHLQAFNLSTDRYALEIVAVDSFPGRAVRFAESARARGLRARGIEADARALAEKDIAPIVLIHVDDAHTVAGLLVRIEGRHVLFLLFVRTPNDRLLTISGAFEPDDVEERLAAALLVAALGYNTITAGSDRVFGPLGMPEHRAIEPLFRHEFGTRVTKNISKMLANLPLEEPGLRVTVDGEHALRTQVRDARTAGFANPAVLAYDFFDRPPFAVEKGEDVVIAEVGPDGEIRFHTIRQRAIDGAVTVGGTAVIDPRGIPPYDTERWNVAGQQQRELLARAAREAITRRRPVYVAD
jgi:hypothetical protein